MAIPKILQMIPEEYQDQVDELMVLSKLADKKIYIDYKSYTAGRLRRNWGYSRVGQKVSSMPWRLRTSSHHSTSFKNFDSLRKKVLILIGS